MERLSRKNKTVLRYLALVIAGIVNATGVVPFLSQAGVLDGGLSGTSMLLGVLSKWPLGIFVVIFNVPFFVVGYKKLGFNFIVNSLVAILSYSLMSFVYEEVIGFGTTTELFGVDIFLCAVFGGLISGIGSGLTIRFGGAMDGMEATAVLYAKKIGLTVGQFVMIYNAVLYIIACFALDNFSVGLYSIVAYTVGLKAVDFVVDGFDKGKGCFIITNKGDEVASALSKEFGRGVTLLSSHGYHSGENLTIYCVVNRFEIGRLKSIVSDVDSSAFVTINEISEVMGSSIKFKKQWKKPDIKKSLEQQKTLEICVETKEIPNSTEDFTKK